MIQVLKKYSSEIKNGYSKCEDYLAKIDERQTKFSELF